MTAREALLPHFIPFETGRARAVESGLLHVDGVEAICLLWDFSVHGGTYGVLDTDTVIAAIDRAIDTGRPLVTVLASGGTRLTEGMRALVGIPRSAIALNRLRAARLAHVCVCDGPTTGGVWVSIGCHADLRAAVEGATIAFTGPRVVEAMTGQPLEAGTATAESARRLGLVDTVLDEGEIASWLGKALHANTQHPPLTIAGADETVAARLQPTAVDGVAINTVRVALASTPQGIVSAAGFRLLARSARLADTLDIPLIITVDTIGGDPHDETTPVAILEATQAVLGCRAPTISLVKGAGGSGGALAGAVTDVVAIGPNGWFGALAPAGAAAALKTTVEDATEMLRLRPEHLLEDGFADIEYDDHPAATETFIAASISRLRAQPEADRLDRRSTRWSTPLPPH